MKNKIKEILVTGAGGYIGSMLVPSLISSGYKVRAIDRFFFGNHLRPNKNLTIINDDIRDMKSNYFKSIYAVIDLAAISNDPSGARFKKQTYEINYKSRVRNAKLAKKNQVSKYLLPSSCSNYGRIKTNQIADETFSLNPLTDYSKANSMAEFEILNISNKSFCPTVIRQGTLFGYSPRLRLDLAINGMTYGIFKNKTLPVMRDGTQRRPMLHIKDSIRAIKFLLKQDSNIIREQIYNIGDNSNNYSINDLVTKFKKIFKNNFKLEWYGSKDKRSYFVSFDKINSLNFYTKYKAEDGILELYNLFKNKNYLLTDNNITLKWYEQLEHWNETIKQVSRNGKILKL